MTDAAQEFAKDVAAGTFPTSEQSFN